MDSAAHSVRQDNLSNRTGARVYHLDEYCVSIFRVPGRLNDMFSAVAKQSIDCHHSTWLGRDYALHIDE